MGSTSMSIHGHCVLPMFFPCFFRFPLCIYGTRWFALEAALRSSCQGLDGSTMLAERPEVLQCMTEQAELTIVDGRCDNRYEM